MNTGKTSCVVRWKTEFQTYVLSGLNTKKAIDFVDAELEPYADAYEIVSRASYESTKDAETINALLRHPEQARQL